MDKNRAELITRPHYPLSLRKSNSALKIRMEARERFALLRGKKSIPFLTAGAEK